ncbi:MAG: rhodanese-like domain-containing protein [Trueperaceae bacterium]
MRVSAVTASHEASSPTARWPFLSVAELRARLERPASERPLLVDARGERQYRDGHLPGSFNLPARELNPIEDGVRRLATFEEIGRRLGPVGNRDAVIYGGRGGADAAHLRWTLRAAGIERVRLLDGGIEAWQAEGCSLATNSEQGPIEAKPMVPTTGDAEPASKRSGQAEPAVRPPPSLQVTHSTRSLVSVDELLRRLGEEDIADDIAILDTREPEEFSGELVAARRGGHIPGAVLFPWTSALGPNLKLRSEAELRELLAPVLAKPEAIIYCQSGVRAAHTLAVLEMLEHPLPRLYLGSWGEWGNREDTPVEVEAGS